LLFWQCPFGQIVSGSSILPFFLEIFGLLIRQCELGNLVRGSLIKAIPVGLEHSRDKIQSPYVLAVATGEGSDSATNQGKRRIIERLYHRNLQT